MFLKTDVIKRPLEKGMQIVKTCLPFMLMVVMAIPISFFNRESVSAAPQSTFIVVADADDSNAHDKNPGDGICADQLDTCTLRAAIEEANAHHGADTITFSQQMSIMIDSTEGPLPALVKTVKIDASSMWNTTLDQPGVTINGNGAHFNGLRISALYCEVYGLTIRNFYWSAIIINTSNNTIGGTTKTQRNVISANANNGIAILGNQANSNTIQGNFIGINPKGNAKLPNKHNGILIKDGASYNKIVSNVISGNLLDGILIQSSNTQLSYGNKIGNNVIGLSDDLGTIIPNKGNGISIMSSPNTKIGGPGLSGNMITGNSINGIYLFASNDTLIQDNIIAGNNQDGIYIHNSQKTNVLSNIIDNQEQNGILINGSTGSTANKNNLTRNSIYSNKKKGISLIGNSNNNIQPPIIGSANSHGAAGTVPNGVRIVAVFSDSENEGKIYHGQCIVNTITHQWFYTGAITGPHVTALAYDLDGNTSEFSTPYTISNPGSYQIYLPFVLRNP